MQNLISVIVPIYNVEKYLERCVRSICDQTYENLEIILVDDGSMQECHNLCDELMKDDARIQVIHKKNGGLSDARNAGIDVAKGDYIIFIDGDDFISSTMIEKLWKRIRADGSDFGLCGINIIDEGGKSVKASAFRLRNEVLSTSEFWTQFYGVNFLPMVVSWNKLYRKDLFENERYDYGKINEDEFIIHRLVDRCKSISVVDEQLYNYVRHDGSIMSSHYSFKRMDVIEALNIRTEYFIEQKQYYFASRTLNHNIGNLLRAYSNLDMKITENRIRYQNLSIEFKKLFWEVFKYERNMKFVLKGLIFLVSPRICKFIFLDT